MSQNRSPSRPSSKKERTVRLRFWRDGNTVIAKVDGSERLMDVLRKNGVMFEGVIVMDKDRPVPLDENVTEIEDGKELLVVRVASGG